MSQNIDIVVLREAIRKFDRTMSLIASDQRLTGDQGVQCGGLGWTAQERNVLMEAARRELSRMETKREPDLANDESMPDTIYVWRHGDDESKNGTWLECDDPANKADAKYYSVEFLATRSEISSSDIKRGLTWPAVSVRKTERQEVTLRDLIVIHHWFSALKLYNPSFLESDDYGIMDRLNRVRDLIASRKVRIEQGYSLTDDEKRSKILIALNDIEALFDPDEWGDDYNQIIKNIHLVRSAIEEKS